MCKAFLKAVCEIICEGHGIVIEGRQGQVPFGMQEPACKLNQGTRKAFKPYALALMAVKL